MDKDNGGVGLSGEGEVGWGKGVWWGKIGTTVVEQQ